MTSEKRVTYLLGAAGRGAQTPSATRAGGMDEPPKTKGGTVRPCAGVSLAPNPAPDRQGELPRNSGDGVERHATPSGNAAAMRDALEHATRFASFLSLHLEPDSELRKAAVAWLVERNAALAAPARNCDRYATAEDAVCAWHDAHPDSEHPNWRALAAWLFDPAAQEGGAE